MKHKPWIDGYLIDDVYAFPLQYLTAQNNEQYKQAAEGAAIANEAIKKMINHDKHSTNRPMGKTSPGST